MIKIRFILLIVILAGCLRVAGQDYFYDPSIVQDVRITFGRADWKNVLDSLFLAQGDEGRLVGDVEVNGKLYHKAGVRYKGYSSWNSGEIKNPLNIDLDYMISGQNYQGHTKLKFSNVIHDPSFVREVLSYEIARKYMPASRANFAAIYVNDVYIGLYSNVEAVDKKFLQLHFGTDSDSFIKGEPCPLQYPFGQNANLAYTNGDDTADYYSYYKRESDAGWSHLLTLIRTLNTDANNLDKVLNVDRALWMHAFNYALLNLDSYIGYSQNYYLYRDKAGRFNTIPWDFNMSFGSFRESDGSNNFLGVSIPKLKELDPLQHLSFSISPRPLMRVLFANDTLRRMYLAHLRTIVNENLSGGDFFTRALVLQSIINTYVTADTNKFYSYDDFINNTTSTVGGSGGMIEYPGLKDLIEARVAYLHTYPGFMGEPVIENFSCYPQKPEKNELVWFKASLSEAERVFLFYKNSSDSAFSSILMPDDGLHDDGIANDHIYGTGIKATGDVIQYYLYAENDTAGVFSPQRAGYEFFTLYPAIQKGNFTINELMASAGETFNGVLLPAAWLELHNNSHDPLNPAGCYLVLNNNLNETYTFPDTIIEGNGFLLLCADGSVCASMLSTGFSLPDGGGKLNFYNSLDQLIDSVTFSEQPANRSVGRYPNGYGTFTYMTPSAMLTNTVGTTPESGFKLYPNPSTGLIHLEFKGSSRATILEIYDAAGKCVYSETIQPVGEPQNAVVKTINISDFAKGLYSITFTGENYIGFRKLLLF